VRAHLTRLRLALGRARYWFGVPLHCEFQGTPEARRGRVSPTDALSFTVGGRDALLCYGRPLARNRRIFGELVPYGELWRTGANEPTVLHLPFAADIAGLHASKG
jgi:hypothetical protein